MWLGLLLLASQAFTLNDVAYIGALQGYTFETETLSYQSAILANSGTILNSDLVAVDQFVKAAKAHGYWSFITDCSPMAGNETNAAMVKLVNHPNSQSATLKGWQVAATNYDRTLGFVLNGSKYLWPGLVTSNNIISGTNNFAAIWVTGQLVNTRSWLYGTENTGAHDTDYFWNGYYSANNGWGYTGFAGGDGSTASIVIAGNPAWGIDQGFWLVDRTNNNAVKVWINGYPVITNTQTVVTTTIDANAAWSLGGRSTGPPFAAPDSLSGNWILSFYSIGSGLPMSAQSDFYNDVLAMQKALGRVAARSTRRPAVLIVGQSNAQGNGGGTAGVSCVYSNLQGGAGFLFTSVPAATNFPSVRLRGFDGWKAFSDELSYLTHTYNGGSTTNESIYESFAINGATYGSLAKGTQPFWASTNWFSTQNDLETLQYGKHLLPLAVVSVHGENDSGSSTYGANMVTWQGDYSTALNSVNGDSFLVPMLHSQIDSYTSGTINLEYVNDQLLTNQENCAGTTNILVMPKYHLPYSDTVHVSAAGQTRMQEQYAWALYKYLNTGSFSPVHPTAIVETNLNQILVTFAGQVGSLFLDTTSVAWLTQPNYGFSYTDSSTPPSISAVTLQDADNVLITLSGSISGHTGRLLSYAHNATTATTACGTSSADGGNLRDSNTEMGFTSTSNLWNWCVHFQKSF